MLTRVVFQARTLVQILGLGSQLKAEKRKEYFLEVMSAVKGMGEEDPKLGDLSVFGTFLCRRRDPD